MILILALAFLGAGENLAGTGQPGDSGDGGPASACRLNMPFDVAFDSGGNLFLSDTSNHRIRRVDARTGTISTIAGSGKKGFGGDGGAAISALLDEPYGLALDLNGNLYFADRLNRRVRRVDATTGLISTVAGDGSKTSSGDGGPAAKAGLVEPNGVALDSRGHLYIADVADHRIRVVDLAAGTITTFAGDGRGHHAGDGGLAARASIHGARAVEVGPDGTVWILERQGNRLRSVDPKTGVITTRSGTSKPGYSGDGGPATDAMLNGPKELCLDRGGNVYIADTENHAIRRIDAATGRITTVVGDGRRPVPGVESPANTDRLDRPHGVAEAPDGSIVVGDTGNHRIRRVRPRSSN
jgi:sugar lactone lactonase YvrE